MADVQAGVEVGVPAGERGTLVLEVAAVLAAHGEHPPADVVAAWVDDLLDGGAGAAFG